MKKISDRRTWELALLARATRFIVAVPSTAPRVRGQRLQWDKFEYKVPTPTRCRGVLAVVCRFARTCGPRALIYAVDDATGDQFALSKEDWT